MKNHLRNNFLRVVGILIISIFFNIALLSQAKAERCWLVDCKGMRGYVFVPRMQYEDNTSICKERAVLAYDLGKYSPYKKLPEIGTVVFSVGGGISIYPDMNSINESFKDFYNSKLEYKAHKDGKLSNLSDKNNFIYYEKHFYKDIKNKDLLIENCARENQLIFSGKSNTWGGNIKAKILSYTKINNETFAYIEILENPKNPK